MRSAEIATCSTSASVHLATAPRRRHSLQAPESRGSTAGDSHVVWIGSNHDGLEHGVTLDRMAANVRSGHGVYDALCGESFIPLSMLSAPRPRCLRCLRQHELLVTVTAQEKRRRLWRIRLGRRSRATANPYAPTHARGPTSLSR